MDAATVSVTELEPAQRVLFLLDEATDASLCGQKAASLAELRRLGFDIPDGFVIPAGCAPPRTEVAAALARLGDGPVAVRSSGVAEDLADASFAGQYETVLNVRGADAVLDAAQRLAFSANPLSGERSEVRISATRGIADKLVSGEVDADEWSVRGPSTTPIAQPQRALEPEQVRRVAELAARCEAARGDVLKGTWQKDAAHFPEPITPFGASTNLFDEGHFLPRKLRYSERQE